MSKKLIIAIIVIVLIFLIWLITRTLVTVVEEPVVEEPVVVERTIRDCNALAEEEAMAKCQLDLLDIFTASLSACNPTIGTTYIGWEPFLGIFRKYEIKGIQNDRCVVKFSVEAIEPGNPEIPLSILEKEMTCTYGPDQRTVEHVARLEGCSGPLYDELQTIFGETPTTDIPSSYTLELDVRIPKDTYQVGQSLEGAEYYLKYEGDPFKAMILYSESTEGLIKKSYSATRGTIQTGDFDNPETLPGLKVSMYSVKPDGTPNPFDCDGNYVYSISVYDCASIDNALGTDDCGEGGWPPTIESEDIVTKVSPLKTASKRISVVCPNGTDCCTNWAYRCSGNNDCLEGYKCEVNKCVKK